jgi:hypothetical protein
MRHLHTSVPWHCIEEFKDVKALADMCTSEADHETSAIVTTENIQDDSERERASSCPLNVHAPTYEPREFVRRSSQASEEYAGAMTKAKSLAYLSPSNRKLPMNRIDIKDDATVCVNRRRISAFNLEQTLLLHDSPKPEGKLCEQRAQNSDQKQSDQHKSRRTERKQKENLPPMINGAAAKAN